VLPARIRLLCRAELPLPGEMGYVPAMPGDQNPFFRFISARYGQRHDAPSTAASPNKGTCSVIPSSSLRCSTAFATTPSSTRSKAQVTASVSMLICRWAAAGPQRPSTCPRPKAAEVTHHQGANSVLAWPISIPFRLQPAGKTYKLIFAEAFVPADNPIVPSGSHSAGYHILLERYYGENLVKDLSETFFAASNQ